MTKKQIDLNNEAERLMSPERAAELKKYFKSIPPVFQQFFLRFMDIRDGIISDALGETVAPMLPILEKLSKGQERIELEVKAIKERMENIEQKQAEDEIQIMLLKKTYELPKNFDIRLHEVEKLKPVVDNLVKSDEDTKIYRSPKWTGIRWTIAIIITSLLIFWLNEQFPDIIHKIFGR